ncbi:MAG: hypothetical protein AAFW87_10135 [Pseudomonadota bacterium]
MKHIFVAAALSALLVSEPALAGSVSEPAMDADVVTQAAMDDASIKTDLLLVTLAYIVFIMLAGGAF